MKSTLQLINEVYKKYIESCISTNIEINIKDLEDIYKQAELIISKNNNRDGRIFKIMWMENFKPIDEKLRKTAAQRVIKDLLKRLEGYDFKAELNREVKPTNYKIIVEILFIEDNFHEKPC